MIGLRCIRIPNKSFYVDGYPKRAHKDVDHVPNPNPRVADGVHLHYVELPHDSFVVQLALMSEASAYFI
jgi:hypothetical protein